MDGGPVEELQGEGSALRTVLLQIAEVQGSCVVARRALVEAVDGSDEDSAVAVLQFVADAVIAYAGFIHGIIHAEVKRLIGGRHAVNAGIAGFGARLIRRVENGMLHAARDQESQNAQDKFLYEMKLHWVSSSIFATRFCAQIRRSGRCGC